MVRALPIFWYSLFTYTLLPFSLLRLLWRSIKAPAYRKRWQERLGWYAQPWVKNKPCVVFHAVSVGEVHAAQPLLQAFMQQHPGYVVVITTSTPTGSARVGSLFGSSIEHVYLPWDLPGATNRFIQRYQPRMLVLLETELWPNLLSACAKQQCQVVLANARLSEKSFAGYQRFAGLARMMLQTLTLVAAQAENDGERFIALGLSSDKLCINGSLKFDVAIDTAKVSAAQTLKVQWQQRPVWIAASTREGEDSKVLQAFMLLLQQLPQALLLLVPRHPERFALAGKQAQTLGLQVQYFSKSFNKSLGEGENLEPATQVLLGDTMGDMLLYYALADVAFVGGSLVNTGCQNIIEPAALGLPVLTGPSLFNFQKVSELLCAAGGMQVIHSPEELAENLVKLLQDTSARREMGGKAREEVLRNQGAAKRLEQRLTALLAQ